MTSVRDYGRDVKPSPKKGRKKFLIRLNVTALIIIGVLCLLIILLLSTGGTEPDGGMTVVGNQFFDSNTCYYLRGSLSGDEHKYLVELMENLDMDKESTENSFEQILLEPIRQDERDIKQYFFYKADDDTIFTFVKSKKKEAQAKPGRVEIKILESENPGRFWAIYHLEKKKVENSDGFLYSLKYLKGKYNNENGRTRSYKCLSMDKADKDIEDILTTFVDGLQEAFYRNPRDAVNNGPTLKILFTLLQNGSRNRFRTKELTLFLAPRRRHFNTFEIDGSRRSEFENDLERVFNDLFSDEYSVGESQRLLEIYGGSKIISKNSQLDSFSGKLKTVLIDNKEYYTFQAWKNLFESKGFDVKFVELLEHNEHRLTQLKSMKDTTIPQENVLETIIITLLLLFIGISLFYLRKILGTRLKEGKKETPDETAEASQPMIDTAPADMKQDDTTGKSAVEEPGAEDSQKVDYEQNIRQEEEYTISPAVQYQTIEKKRRKLKEIGTSLDYLLLEVIRSEIHAPDRRAIEELRAASKISNYVLANKNINQEFFDSKIGEMLENFRKFRGNSNKPFLNTDFDEIEAKLNSLRNEKSPKEKSTGDATPEPILKGTNDTKHVLTAIQQDLAQDRTKFTKLLLSLNEKFKEVAQAAKAPLENKEMLSELRNRVDRISNDMRIEHKFYQMMSYVNKETNLTVKRSNVLEVIQKVSDEPRISKEYRLCAVNLHDELSGLEDEYQDKWFWKLLVECFFSRLKENIDFFGIRNDSGKTIYDRYFGTEISLRKIEHKHIRRIVAQLHWIQIWDGLIRMSDFFNAYFDDEMADIKYALGYYSQKIKKILLELGYKVEEMRHLAAISSEFRKNKSFEQADQSYIENTILKNLTSTGNKQLREAVKNIPAHYEQVVYVERLGLIDKLSEPPVQITNLRFGAYKKEILQAYVSSQSGMGSQKKVVNKKKESKR